MTIPDYQIIRELGAGGMGVVYLVRHKGARDQIEVVGKIVPIRQRDSRIPSQVAEVIDRSLATETSERYQHAGEMHEALAKALK